METNFIPYEQALALKELGFNEAHIGYYYDKNPDKIKTYASHNGRELTSVNYIEDGFTKAVLYQQAFRWFRENHKLRTFIDIYAQDEENDWQYFYVLKQGNGYDVKPIFSGNFDSYEEAELACLIKLIEIVKSKS